jgi:hypothetical protein
MASKDSARAPILEDMEEPRPQPAATCDEVRSTRLHYRLRCLLTPGHEGEHRWTPELVPDLDDEAAAV